MSKSAFSFGAALVPLAMVVTIGLASAAKPVETSAAGTWSVTYSGSPLTPGPLVLKQVGSGIVGSYGTNGSLSGSTHPGNPLQIDASWKDSRGVGWATLIFNASYTAFHGSWGFGGRPANGTFVAERVYNQINTTGTWNVLMTGEMAHSTQLVFKQTGPSFIGTWAGGHIQGTLSKGSEDVQGQWQTPKGYGPINLKFSADGNSFHGTWGYPGKPSSGVVNGTRAPQ